jgi:hypothetical protein
MDMLTMIPQMALDKLIEATRAATHDGLRIPTTEPSPNRRSFCFRAHRGRSPPYMRKIFCLACLQIGLVSEIAARTVTTKPGCDTMKTKFHKATLVSDTIDDLLDNTTHEELEFIIDNAATECKPEALALIRDRVHDMIDENVFTHEPTPPPSELRLTHITRRNALQFLNEQWQGLENLDFDDVEAAEARFNTLFHDLVACQNAFTEALTEATEEKLAEVKAKIAAKKAKRPRGSVSKIAASDVSRFDERSAS